MRKIKKKSNVKNVDYFMDWRFSIGIHLQDRRMLMRCKDRHDIKTCSKSRYDTSVTNELNLKCP
jgi:hypothetical protein